MCGSRENTLLPHGRSLEIHRGGGGRGVFKAKFLGEMYENKLEFPAGREVQNKSLPWGKYIWMFSVTAQSGLGISEIEKFP